jgi:hypothetical protein
MLFGRALPVDSIIRPLVQKENGFPTPEGVAK